MTQIYLEKHFELYQEDENLQKLKHSLAITKKDDFKNRIKIYTESIDIIENNLWENKITDSAINDYQALFREYEAHIDRNNYKQPRYKFIITIPVADRPQHLATCLQSILTLCEKYAYGGLTNGTYNKVCVLISDDSQYANNIKQHKKLANHLTQKGLECIYFGEPQQKELLSTLKGNINNIIGDMDSNIFYHKGASIIRNISYLKLQQLEEKNQPCLFYFIDSDQEFKINIPTPNGNKNIYAINYFYQLNKIFSQNEVSILTGKVVGDPPVSPAVMAGTFIDDVINFTKQVMEINPEKICQFHNAGNHNTSDAAYHDMAVLFGYQPKTQSYNYHCDLKDNHTNEDCFVDFSKKLNHFFDGEHPTRKSYYQHENTNSGIKPARTIYTGNYIFKPENLKYFIPFSNLKLRMAGPVLGRLIQSELGEQFVSANLPMLHNRTVNSSGQSEFRPGVKHHQHNIDLSGEFTRQFFGDVMLFSIIELTKIGYPKKNLTLDSVEKIVYKTFTSMQNKYTKNQKDISKKIAFLKNIFTDFNKHENKSIISNKVIKNYQHFIKNIEINFEPNTSVYKTINTPQSITPYLKNISNAIVSYNHDRLNWQSILLNRTITQ